MSPANQRRLPSSAKAKPHQSDRLRSPSRRALKCRAGVAVHSQAVGHRLLPPVQLDDVGGRPRAEGTRRGRAARSRSPADAPGRSTSRPAGRGDRSGCGTPARRRAAGARRSASAGSIRRRGPIHCTGKARSLNTGSVSRLSPAICSSTVECPIQVAVCSAGLARGYETRGGSTGKAPRAGRWGRRPRATLSHPSKEGAPVVRLAVRPGIAEPAVRPAVDRAWLFRRRHGVGGSRFRHGLQAELEVALAQEMLTRSPNPRLAMPDTVLRRRRASSRSICMASASPQMPG